jgi:hypothetical protein
MIFDVAREVIMNGVLKEITYIINQCLSLRTQLDTHTRVGLVVLTRRCLSRLEMLPRLVAGLRKPRVTIGDDIANRLAY